MPRRYFRNDCGRELEESERGARELEWLVSFFDRSGKVSRDVISQDAFQTPSVLLFSPLGSERAESKEPSANSSNRRQRARAKREREREHQIRKKLRERTTSEREKKTCLLFVSLGLSTHTSKQKSKKAKKQTIAPYRWRLFRQQLLFPTKPGIMQRATAQTGARGAGGPVALRQQQQRRMPMLSRPSSSSSSPSASPSFLLRSATEKAASSSTSTADGNESEGDIRSKANRRGRFLCLGGSGKSFETSKRLDGSLGTKPDVGPSSSSSSSSSLQFSAPLYSRCARVS